MAMWRDCGLTFVAVFANPVRGTEKVHCDPAYLTFKLTTTPTFITGQVLRNGVFGDWDFRPGQIPK